MLWPAAGREIVSVDADPILSPLPHHPGVLLIHLLDRCNIACEHCYLDALPSGNKLLPVELVTRSLGEAGQFGIRTIYLSGGEPLLYPHLSEVLAYGSRNSELELCISTNATLIGDAEAKLLRETRANVQVSVDGPEAYHDRFRGSSGTFRHSRKGIERLVAAGVPVTIVSTICRDNLVWLPWLAEWATDIGAERISVQPLFQLGRGARIPDKKLSQTELCDLFLQFSDLGHRYRSRGLRFSLVYKARCFLLAHPCAAYVCEGIHCHRKAAKEIKTLVIREDGTVLPEIPTLDPRFALGNLHNATLRELVARYFAADYSKFQLLCRTVYEELMPSWTSPIVPWDEIISLRSWLFDG